MARVIIGGQMLCRLLTLLVTPVAHSLFDDLGTLRAVERLGAWFGARSTRPGAASGRTAA